MKEIVIIRLSITWSLVIALYFYNLVKIINSDNDPNINSKFIFKLSEYAKCWETGLVHWYILVEINKMWTM